MNWQAHYMRLYYQVFDHGKAMFENEMKEEKDLRMKYKIKWIWINNRVKVCNYRADRRPANK